jgi:N-acetylgalactosamine-6-sulfatase
MKIIILRLFLFLAVLATTSAFAQSLDERRPNIVMIFADDLGTGDLGCYGHPYAITSNIDRLATEGTRFTRFYATGVTCCPSRTGFMTSHHPASFDAYMADFGFGSRITITELLQGNGYATGHFGKWHIGADDNGVPEDDYGLDEVKIIGNSDGAGRDDDLFAAAIDFIQRHRDEPFYVNIWGHISHYPVLPAKNSENPLAGLELDESRFDSYMAEKFANTRQWGFSAEECLRNYLADVYSLDRAVGRVLNILDELNLSENTIVVFSSDQGAAPNGEFQNDRQRAMDPIFKANMLGWAGGLRGGKHTKYEGGVRIPFILRWPGQVPANNLNATSVLSGLDWLPTLCALTDTSYDPSQFEGLNVADIWRGSDRIPTRTLFWKAGGEAALQEPWKLHLTNLGPELYHLGNDPRETTNVASKFPEITRQISTAIEKWQQTLPSKVRRKGDS